MGTHNMFFLGEIRKMQWSSLIWFYTVFRCILSAKLVYKILGQLLYSMYPIFQKRYKKLSIKAVNSKKQKIYLMYPRTSK